MVIIIENQIGSKPSAIPRGKNIGIVRTRNPKESIKQPPTKYMNRINARTIYGDTGSPAAKSAIMKGRRVTARKRPKMIAPVTSTKTKQEIFKVSRIDFTIPAQVSLPATAVITRVRNTPTAPASVGVKIPM